MRFFDERFCLAFGFIFVLLISYIWLSANDDD
ncbi:hypothetical protein EDD70_3011 [Hydrogenoanaerobacterium saccharovorans]|uniref:Uncharacterized protein n=1 Tax=Hydrogenoanaerobacterium saccharovorans TaxID=474960 RepID=A0A1H8EHX5_9FIRM|nr:hypothetical protein EDD70_3011 [Hydrogenoanaerobacterium saccharovorans]SEN19073.1 hypothetical protein SAMN05216180_3025 [Hydrogenoanaerobacterium saccharovorans]